MELQDIVQILSDAENQPHQYVGQPDILKTDLQNVLRQNPNSVKYIEEVAFHYNSHPDEKVEAGLVSFRIVPNTKTNSFHFMIVGIDLNKKIKFMADLNDITITSVKQKEL